MCLLAHVTDEISKRKGQAEWSSESKLNVANLPWKVTVFEPFRIQ